MPAQRGQGHAPAAQPFDADLQQLHTPAHANLAQPVAVASTHPRLIVQLPTEALRLESYYAAASPSARCGRGTHGRATGLIGGRFEALGGTQRQGYHGRAHVEDGTEITILGVEADRGPGQAAQASGVVGHGPGLTVEGHGGIAEGGGAGPAHARAITLGQGAFTRSPT